MVRYGFLAGIMMALAATAWAGDIVVLTATPVAEFELPDGSVLENAYVWRRSSQGLMIMHDGGNYFLNFKLLPEDWKAAYLGAPEDGDAPAKLESLPKPDKYRVAAFLEQIPGLDAETRRILLGGNHAKDLDQNLLALGLLQSLLTNDREAAQRFLIIAEEKGYKIEAVGLDRLFAPCEYCGGDGQLAKSCKACGGSGDCSRCEGEGTREALLQGASRTHCTTCRGTGVCRSCKGEGGFTPTCPKCKGAGKLLNRQYCEILRARLVRGVNASILNGPRASVASGSASGIGQVLAELPELKPEAQAFYLSEAYTGKMDADILAACILHALLEGDPGEAKRFGLMLRVEFPGGSGFEVEKYLQPDGQFPERQRAEIKLGLLVDGLNEFFAGQ